MITEFVSSLLNMDQTQWNTLNQMLTSRPKSGQVAGAGKTTASAGGRMAGTVQTRVISASGGMSQQRGARQQLNGAQQDNVGGGVVKSLLTGRQYAQSVLRPDLGRGQAKSAATRNTPKQQVSLLQPQWQQQQTVDTSSVVAETQQIMLSGLPENINPGETLYVVVDGVTYQIDSSNAEQLLAAASGTSLTAGAGGAVGSRISLEDLANISAEQQTLSLDYQGAGDIGAVSANDIKLEMQVAASSSADSASGMGIHQIDGQQFFDAQSGTTTTVSSGNGNEQMQIIILPAEGGDMKSGDFKVGGQDFILQSGQQLPQELQDMVARGLPIDFSNYEFVIQDEDGNVQQDGSGGTTYLSVGQSLAGASDGSGMIVSLAGSGAGGANSDDILGMLAEASSQQGQSALHQWGISGTGASSAVQIIEEDDGEFAYLTEDIDALGDPGSVGPPRQIQESGFLTAFADFLSGAKAETLSSVANSTVVRRAPQLPIAYVPEPNRKGGSAHDDKTKSPMTIVLTESATGQQVVYVNESGTPVSGRGRGRGRGRPPSRYIVQRFPSGSGTPQKGDDGDKAGTSTPSTKEQIRQSIIAKRKRKGSDSDSFEDDDDGDGSSYQIITSADLDKEYGPGTKFAVQTEAVRPPPVYRGRGRPRGSTLANRNASRGGGANASASAASSLTTAELLANASQQLIVTQPADANSFHLNPTEPHNYQKGDFVVERKDGWKTESFPIWRIETGKLLQKFDPLIIEGGIIHKSASVYSSWSGDIRTSFRAVLVDMITSTAGRKQETVKVQEKFLTKPADDSLDEDPLMSTFIVFMHTMLSAAIDPNFLATILQNEEDEYYMSSVRQIDTLLSAATQSILSQISWNETFKLTTDALPYYTMTSLSPTTEAQYQCQACEDGVTPAVRSVKFYGVLYDRDLMTATQEVEKASAQEFLIGKAASEILISYHALHHFKFLLFQKCQEETNYLRQARKLTETDSMSECLQNRIFLQHHFRELQTLLQQFIIVEHAVEPAIDPSIMATDVDDQQMIDPQAIVSSGIDTTAVDQHPMDDTSALVMEPSVSIVEPIDMEPTGLVDDSAGLDAVAMETSSADDQLVLDQTEADVAAAEGMELAPADECPVAVVDAASLE